MPGRSWVESEDEQDLLRQTNTKKSNKQDRYDNGKEDGFQVGIKVCARYLEGEDYFPGTTLTNTAMGHLISITTRRQGGVR